MKDGKFYHIISKAPGILDTYSWQEISEEQDAADLFSIGDEKSVTLTNGEEVIVQIADFAHDTYATGGTAPITFVMRDCLNATRQMNGSDTNSGGWQNSAMRSYCNGELLSLFPTELKNLIKQVNKKGYNGNTTTLQTTADYLWLLADSETFVTPNRPDEGNLYPIFSDDNTRIKHVKNEADDWWLRTPLYNGAFLHVDPSGHRGNYLAKTYAGIAVGFCI